jgi:hypothetical protein
MKTRFAGNRRVNTVRYAVASLFVAASLIVSACSPAAPSDTIIPNQTAPNSTQPVTTPPPAVTPNTSPSTTTTTPPPTPPATTPNVTVNNTTTPPPELPTPNATQNTTPEPPAANTTTNATQALASFKTVQTRFNMFCAVKDCHDGTGNTTLKLLPGISYSQLVNVTSDFLKSKLRVKPGAPDQSVIMIMVNDPEHCTVPQSVIDLIKQWILEGALNN